MSIGFVAYKNSVLEDPEYIRKISDLEIAICKAMGAAAEHRRNYRTYYPALDREELRDGWVINTEGRLIWIPQGRVDLMPEWGPAPKPPLLFPTEEEAWRAYLNADQYGESHHYASDPRLFRELQRYLVEKVGGFELKGDSFTGMTGRVLCNVGPMRFARDGSSIEEAVCRAFLASWGADS